jgi:hypothetical protein
MNSNDHNSTGMAAPQSPAVIDPSSVVADQSRRRFTTSGLVVSCVLMTLATRPVLGQTVVCKSPSGFLSGNASVHGPAPICTGRDPVYWSLPSTNWGATSRTTLFSLVFGNGIPAYAGATLDTIVASVDPNQLLGKYLVAALLNARSGFTSFLTETTIKAMYTEWRFDRTFSPTAGVDWGIPEMVNYLSQTQA